ncbi:chemotaxis protein [Afipia sp. Root123D2]|uniref:DUF6468 domain-containing protein n=1 Tax=Afipia sp. Root123D2 TaxID=1736436 RepID=UPI0006FB7B7F|nr:DUF6468 domain-containing protein [Afipia sp. Root123D2]KQW22378.1 chemotaxis protein [Afipia sp. Root123D2]
MSHSFGFMIESMVAVLLLFTIWYCMILNRRLKALKADEHSLKATISELITATEIAERAIGGLKITVRECDANLGEQLSTATALTEKLGRQILIGDEILKRLSQIAMAARPAEVESMPAARAPDARALVAAAQAFSERRRAGIAA